MLKMHYKFVHLCHPWSSYLHIPEELHNVLINEFDEDVMFEKVSQLNMIRLQNKDVKIDYKFKIINITKNEDLEIVKETLKNIQEQLTTWALNKKSKINFVFKIE